MNSRQSATLQYNIITTIIYDYDTNTKEQDYNVGRSITAVVIEPNGLGPSCLFACRNIFFWLVTVFLYDYSKLFFSLYFLLTYYL